MPKLRKRRSRFPTPNWFVTIALWCFVVAKVFFFFHSKQNAVRAVAKKSTSKVLKSPPFSPSSIRSDDYYGSTEHKGRIKCRPNDSYVEMVFEPHQCGSMCIQDYPFADGDFKSNYFLKILVQCCQQCRILPSNQSNLCVPDYNPLAVPMFCGWSREGREFVDNTSVCDATGGMYLFYFVTQ